MKLPQKKQKAGGVVIRDDLSEPYVLIIIEANGSYGFVKGKRKSKEGLKKTSMRETQEESGLRDLQISADLGIHTIRQQQIHFYLYEIHRAPYHSLPHEAIRWMKINEARNKLNDEQNTLLDLALKHSKSQN